MTRAALPARWQDCYPDAVWRYVATYIGRDGLRTLATPAQGRHTFETAAAAQTWIDAIRANTRDETLRSVFGDPGTLAVCACPCWPGHFDPCGVYFDDEDIVR